MQKINPLDHPVCFTQPLRLLTSSAWNEHVPFGMFLIDLLRPKVLVELGTHAGVSYCAFCQAVKQLGLDTHCYAVDTWEGDIHAGFYGAEVLADLRAHHDPLYGDFSRLVQSTFDEAVKYFPDDSIDFLHIDGMHTYESVKHDFETWLPKLSERAVILFHDINVRERDFGVWRVWEELSVKYPSFSMLHGHGLGVLAAGKEYPRALNALLEMQDDEIVRIRELFYQLGRQLEIQLSVQELSAQLEAKEQVRQELSAQLEGKEQARQELTAQLAEKGHAMDELSAQVVEKEQVAQALMARVNSLEEIGSELREKWKEAEKGLQSLNVELGLISGSRLWHIVLFLRRVRVWLIPPGSTREKILRVLYLWAHKFRVLLERIFRKRPGLDDFANNGLHPAGTAVTGRGSDSGLRRNEAEADSHVPYKGSLPVFLTPFSQSRLNIVVDDIDSNQPFGRMAATIILSSLLSEKWGYDMRIITTEKPQNRDYFRDILRSNNISWDCNVEFLTINPDSSKAELPVGQGDIFLAASWWTAASILNVLGDHKVIYLLQEDERENLLKRDDLGRCLEIFQNPRIKFIVNTKSLYEHLISEGFENMRANGVWFEPSWPESLFYPASARPDSRKNFLYTVSDSSESLIDLGFKAIEDAINKGIFDLKEWDFFCVSKGSQKIKSSHSFLLKHYQDLGWENYLSLLRKTDLGLSLTGASFLLPDYNPLDLLASGAVVVSDFLESRPGLNVLSKNLLCCTSKVDEITQGLVDGAALVQDAESRLQNFRENRLLKDWRITFQEVLASMEKWRFNVPV